MDSSKRKFLQAALLGAGSIGLRAFATGLPMALLSRPLTARADTPDSGALCAKPQYLILATSGSGDPLNANVPGSYVTGTYHPMDTGMTPTAVSLGGTSYMAAKPWATMDASILSRTCFFHHATYTNSHGDAPKVNRLMGAVQRQEMLISMLAKNLAPCLGGGTVQPQPVVLGQNLITYAGAVLPPLTPINLKNVLLAPASPLLKSLQKLRDTDLDSLNALFKQSGTTAQRALLDKYALSQSQVRNINQTILSQLTSITGATRADYNTAASVLIQLNVSPVVVMTYSFGGDNHGDTNLAGESAQTIASVTAIADLATKLKAANHYDDTTIAFQNVFGRTLSTVSHSNNADGRNHNANHHCSVIIGSRIKSSVIGGITLNSSSTDFRAMGFDGATGAPNDSGSITFQETLGSVGKTIGAAVGVDQTVLDTQITLGQTIKAALAS